MDGIVLTTAGAVRGVEENGLWVFKGVPYGHSGAGSERWRVPMPPAPWRGVRDGGFWGPVAPQSPPQPGFSIPGDPTDSSENCLNLNIWTPGIDDRTRPVMVWVHGGGFTSGSGASLLYRGDRLASRGDVVVVTINYRLGALGFLAHPALSEHLEAGGGNWGLLDQVQALTWVAENIASFGGDPSNVTLFGESAGAMSISALLAAPSARGLFQRAVVQSGPPTTSSIRWATARAQRLAALVGVADFGRADMQDIAADALVQGTQQLAGQIPADGGLPLPYMPVVDGRLLMRPPMEVVTAGQSATVPLMIGTTRDEATPFTLGDIGRQDLDAHSIANRLARHVGTDDVGDVIETYLQARSARGESVSGRDLWTAIVTDYVFRLPSMSYALAYKKHQPSTFLYLFAWESPFMGGVFGSSHGLEIPFVFGTVHEQSVGAFAGHGPEAERLSDQMQDAWLAFAHSGDPSCDAAGNWPPYDGQTRPTMVFGPAGGVQDDPRGEERGSWELADVAPNGGHHHE